MRIAYISWTLYYIYVSKLTKNYMKNILTERKLEIILLIVLVAYIVFDYIINHLVLA